jgi:hypothetical protein
MGDTARFIADLTDRWQAAEKRAGAAEQKLAEAVACLMEHAHLLEGECCHGEQESNHVDVPWSPDQSPDIGTLMRDPEIDSFTIHGEDGKPRFRVGSGRYRYVHAPDCALSRLLGAAGVE